MQKRRSGDRLGHFGQFVMFELRAKLQALHDTFTYMTNVLFSDFEIEVACAEWDSSAPPFRRWMFRRWNVKCVFLRKVAKVRPAVVWEARKRKSQSSTCPWSFQLCCIYCDSWCILWIWKCHYCIFVHR